MREYLTGDRAAPVEVFARATLAAGPWSVTFRRPEGLGITAGPNDYVSEGPYWWPDPKNPSGPYIRKDGERNPKRFMGNRTDLSNMCTAVLSLGMGAALLKMPGCVEHGAKALSTWFIDPKTRMNPNLEYGQMVRGINTGRGTGLIDTVSLIHAAQGVALLELAGGLDPSVSRGVRDWYTEFLKWMTTSKKGLDEKKSGNNHATWWTAQVATYAAFTGDSKTSKMAWDHYRDYLVPTEIRPDGSCPREEERTNSLGYSAMNLDGFSVVCRLGEMDGVDLWKGVDNAFHYLTPYMLHPEKWRKQQISKFSATGHFFPGLGGIGIPADDLLAAYNQLPKSDSPWTQFIDLIIRYRRQ